MDNPDNLILITIIGAIVSALGGIAAIASNLFKLKADNKKTNAEGDSVISDAAESIAKSAVTSSDLLLARLNEMEAREKKRDEREEALLKKVLTLEANLADWQDWARRLVHQLRSHNLEPVPFKLLPRDAPRLND